MDLSLLLLQKIITLLLIVFMGFLSVKQGTLKSEHSSVLSHVCFDWLVPFSLINAFITTDADDVMGTFLFACGVALIMILMFIGFSFLLGRPLHLNPAEQGSLMFTNSAGMALPMAQSLLGSGSVIFCAPHMAIQNFFIFTILPYIMYGKAEGGWKRVFKNRNLVAIAIGLLLFALKPPLPSFITDTISTVGNCNSAICMFMIGILMGGVDFRKLIQNRKIYLITLLRLILFPLAAIILIRLLGIPQRVPSAGTAMMVLVMCMSSPVASLVTQMSDLYLSREEAQESGSINVMTTLVCCITMPLMILIYQVICG